jgi:uncharacterized protein YrrD
MSTAKTVELLLLRATEITGRPVVCNTTGEALADVKDVLYSPEDGRVTGFTLNKRGGLFSGPLKTALLLEHVHAIGRDAVTVESEEALGAGEGGPVPRSRNVLGNDVLTDGGDILGSVTDLIVRGGVIGGSKDLAGEVVGYQVRPTTAGKDETHDELVPLPYALAVSGTHLVVPATVRPFVTSDLSGFGGAVADFRAQLGKAPR